MDRKITKCEYEVWENFYTSPEITPDMRVRFLEDIIGQIKEKRIILINLKHKKRSLNDKTVLTAFTVIASFVVGLTILGKLLGGQVSTVMYSTVISSSFVWAYISEKDKKKKITAEITEAEKKIHMLTAKKIVLQDLSKNSSL